jgi:glycosyltransferase involved in cell wall biosynthesis
MTKVLYVSSNGGIHDYRFLKKLVLDYEVLFLHYASSEIIDEIDKIENLEIISKRPAFRSMPVISERNHIKKVINEFKPDIIHSGYLWQTGILAALSGFHPHLSMPWGSDILTDPENNYIKRYFVKKVLNSCDHIQCDAEYVKNKIVKDFKISANKITVFPWGIELEKFYKSDKSEARKKLNISENKFVIIYNRSLENIYGYRYLLEAFLDFSRDKNDVIMLMLSDGSGKNEVIKYINENELEEKILLIGRVPNNELPVFLNSSDIYVSSSLSDGTSLSLLEAMACGLGIIVTNVPAITEWVNNNNAIVVNKKNIKELSDAMNEYYNNRKKITEHSFINIEIAKQKADWNKNYEKLKLIYSNLLSL